MEQACRQRLDGEELQLRATKTMVWVGCQRLMLKNWPRTKVKSMIESVPQILGFLTIVRSAHLRLTFPPEQFLNCHLVNQIAGKP
jgi:hypothetical protein